MNNSNFSLKCEYKGMEMVGSLGRLILILSNLMFFAMQGYNASYNTCEE